MKMRSSFVTNTTPPEAAAAKSIQKLTCNFVPSGCRLDTLEGRQHTVIPMVMLVEGVHTGSDGPLYYPKEELNKTPVVWNHKPIVVYHPEMNGQGISACDPVVINTRKVGLIMNAKFDAGRLKAEAWIEQDRANKVDARIMAAITKNEMMELSTGVFVDVERAPGEWQKETYDGIARNYRPDHLALLPDMTGACSIADGAGLLRNQAKSGVNPTVILKNAVDWLSKRWGLTNNELSFDNTQAALATALRAKFNITEGSNSFLWVDDVYSNFVIYEVDGKLFRLAYTTTDVGVTLAADNPVEVKRVTEYRTVDGAFVGNEDHKEETMNNKAQMILAILAAGAASGWSESDRPVLEKMTDNQVKAIHNAVQPPKPPAPDPKKVLVDAIIANNQYGWAEEDRTALMTMNETQLGKLKLTAPAAPATNAQAGSQQAAPAPAIVQYQPPATVDAYIAAAPSGVQELLRNSMDALNAEKGRLIGAITKNANNPFTAEQLQVKAIGELRALAQLAGGALNAQQGLAPNYSGMAPVTDNSAPVTQEVLAVPVMTFGKK